MTGKPLAEQLAHEPYPEVAAAMRSRMPMILKAWRKASLEVLPHLADDGTITDFENDIGRILDAVADSLERDDAWRVAEVLYHAPKHGVDRFLQEYALDDLLIEHRLLRAVIVLELEEEIGRPMRAQEAASLHAVIDVIFQSATKSYAEMVNEKLREAARSELRLLSFYHRDLKQTLRAATSELEAAGAGLRNHSGVEALAASVESTNEKIRSAGDRMIQLLTREQRHRSVAVPRGGPVRLADLVGEVVQRLKSEAAQRRVEINLEIDPAREVEIDAELLALVLENIISNAIAHGGHGAIRIKSAAVEGGRCRISIADQGPGIPDATRGRIIDAFACGEALSAQGVGVGVGLGIAAQAAKLLRAEVNVETRLGAGTAFHVLLPVRRSEPAAPERVGGAGGAGGARSSVSRHI